MDDKTCEALKQIAKKLELLRISMWDCNRTPNRYALGLSSILNELDILAAANAAEAKPVAWMTEDGRIGISSDALYKAWMDIGADLKGLSWNAFIDKAAAIDAMAPLPAPMAPMDVRPSQIKMTVRDGIWWPDGYATDPSGKIIPPAGKDIDFNFGHDIGFSDGLAHHKTSVDEIRASLSNTRPTVQPVAGVVDEPMTDAERIAFERFDKPEWTACSNLRLRVLLSICHETITQCGARIENLQDSVAALSTHQVNAAQPEPICEMWGAWYDGSDGGRPGWIGRPGFPTLFWPLEKAEMVITSNASYQPRLIRMYAAPSDQMGEQQERNRGFANGVEAAAKWVDQRRFDFDAEHGCVDPDTGTMEYGRGRHAELKEEHASELAEIAEGIRSIAAQPEKDAERIDFIESLAEFPRPGNYYIEHRFKGGVTFREAIDATIAAQPAKQSNKDGS